MDDLMSIKAYAKLKGFTYDKTLGLIKAGLINKIEISGTRTRAGKIEKQKKIYIKMDEMATNLSHTELEDYSGLKLTTNLYLCDVNNIITKEVYCPNPKLDNRLKIEECEEVYD